MNNKIDRSVQQQKVNIRCETGGLVGYPQILLTNKQWAELTRDDLNENNLLKVGEEGIHLLNSFEDLKTNLVSEIEEAEQAKASLKEIDQQINFIEEFKKNTHSNSSIQNSQKAKQTQLSKINTNIAYYEKLAVKAWKEMIRVVQKNSY